MEKIKMFTSELKVMHILWEKGTLPAKEIAKELNETLGWNVNTTYTLIKRCIKKNTIARSEPNFICTPLVDKSEIQMSKLNDLLEEVYDGSIANLFSAVISNQKLSKDDINELKRMIENLES